MGLWSHKLGRRALVGSYSSDGKKDSVPVSFKGYKEHTQASLLQNTARLLAERLQQGRELR